MDRNRFQQVIEDAARECGCIVADVDFNDDDNVFEVVISKQDGGVVDLSDCEHVHRAVLAAFDRDVEDYALTVGSAVLSPEEADEMLKNINEE